MTPLSLRLLCLLFLASLSMLTTPNAMARAPGASQTQTDAAMLARSGSWYDPSHDGEGFIIQFIDDGQAVVYWFTFDEDGNQRWFLGVGTATGDVLQLDVLQVTEGGEFGAGFDPSAIGRIDVGELTITFDDGAGLDRNALAEYTVNGVDGSQSLVRLTRPIEVSSGGAGIPTRSGSWYNPDRDGEGFVVEILPNGVPLAYWFTYDLDGNQAWMVGIGRGPVTSGSVQLDMQSPVGGRFGPDFDPGDVQRPVSGVVRLGLPCSGAFYDFETALPATFSDFGFDIRRLVGIGPGACVDPLLVEQFPVVNGEAELPDHDAANQFEWFLDVLGRTNAISDAEIQQHFSPAWLGQINVQETRDFLLNTRAAYPGARYTDPVGVTSIQVRGVITGDNGAEAWVSMTTNLASGRIDSLGVSNFGPNATVIYNFDANLGLEAAADRFAGLSEAPGLLLARVNANNSCQPIVARNADTPRATASIFKVWVLAGVADAIDKQVLFHDQVVPLDGTKQVLGGLLGNQAAGTPMTIDQLSTLMLGISDNTATDMLLSLAGRSRVEGLHASYGIANPLLMTPQLGISEQFHLFFSFPLSESQSYVNGTVAFRRNFLETRIIPLGAWGQGGGGGYNHESLYIDGSWQASPMAVCRAFARHRLHPRGSDAALLVERALGAESAQPNVREEWDRVWYKGGSLTSGVNGDLVLTHAWLLEREGERPLVLVGMSNNQPGGLDQFLIQSILGRLLELAAAQ